MLAICLNLVYLIYMTTNKDTISIVDLIENESYKNHQAYNLSRALLDIAAQARAIKNTVSENISGDGKVFNENVDKWMTEINNIANNAVKVQMLTK